MSHRIVKTTTEKNDYLEAEILGSKILKAKGLLEDSVIGGLAFTGKFEKNKTQGQTTLENSSLAFNGQFKGNKANGIGMVKIANGLYIGEWAENLYHGYGRFIKPNLTIYEGFFYKGIRKGLGIEIFPKGDVYIGEFRDDAKHGLGLYFFGKGGFYYGFFIKGKREGFGILIDRHGLEVYRGNWKESRKWGRGIEHFPTGAKYDGFFVNGKREGCGMMEYSKQLTYIGTWKENKKHGFGKLECLSGEISGKFLEDKIVEASYVNPSVYYDELMKKILPKSVEAYIKKQNISILKRNRQSQEDLESLLTQSLNNLVYGLLGQQQQRLHVYLLTRSLLGCKLSIDQQISKLGFLLTHRPSLSFPLNVWEPKFDEFLGTKKDFSWSFYKLILDQKYESMEIRKNKEQVDMIITHKIVKGTLDKYTVEGANEQNGSILSFISNEGKRLQMIKKITVYPFFLLIENKIVENKSTRRVSFNDNFKGNLENIQEEVEKEKSKVSESENDHMSSQVRLEKMLKNKRVINFNKDFLSSNILIPKSGEGTSNKLEKQNLGILLSKKAIFYTGEFFFNSDKKVKKKLSMMLNIDSNGRIYSLGRDSVGAFLIVGSRWSDNSAHLMQKYFDDYEIEYKCFLFSDETIQGNWNTTNMKGGFVLRRLADRKLTDLIVPALDNLFPSKEMQRHVPISKIKRHGEIYSKAGLWAVPSFKEFLESSILAVLVRGSQGGVPISDLEEKEKILDERLFEEYRKMNSMNSDGGREEIQKNIESNMSDSIDTEDDHESQSGSESNDYITVNRNSKIFELKSILTEEALSNLRKTIKRKSMLSDANDMSRPEIRKLRSSRASFSLMNEDIRNRLDRLTNRTARVSSINSELEETRNRLKSIDISAKKQNASNEQNKAFLAKLSNIIGNLRKVSKEQEDDEIQNLLVEECFSWKGELVTLGKTEDFVMSNLFILKDRIEGVYNDADRLSYELAGSFSLRTNEFEIIGMSKCKSRSIKFKGSLNSKFELEGTLTSRPMNQAPSNLRLKMVGLSAKAELFEVEEGQLKREIPVLIKHTAHLIYGILKVDNSYMFLSGIKGTKGLFTIEIMAKHRSFRGMVLNQEVVETSLDEGQILKFKNNKIHLTIKY
jgi:hypothetical protein